MWLLTLLTLFAKLTFTSCSAKKTKHRSLRSTDRLIGSATAVFRGRLVWSGVSGCIDVYQSSRSCFRASSTSCPRYNTNGEKRGAKICVFVNTWERRGTTAVQECPSEIVRCTPVRAAGIHSSRCVCQAG